MKLIRSVVDPEKVDHIKAALEKLHVSGITLTNVRDHVPQKVQTVLVWRARRFTSSFFEKVEIEVTVDDDDVDAVVDVIMEVARTGNFGDGHVSIIPVEHRYVIRTGARDVS
jgi:nitrogen regulatory protein P-II 1